MSDVLDSAGVGDAPIAHSVVKTNRPPTEGFVASLEPFVDTIIVCSMTALTIVVTGTWRGADLAEVSGVTLTSRAALAPVILFTDSVFFLAALVNVSGLYFLAKVVRREFSKYWDKLHAGEIEKISETRGSPSIPTAP